MSYLCPFCDHGQFFKGQHSPKAPCTHYVDRLGAECGCVGQARGPLKTGLDDGPLLPSPQQLERASRKIDQESRTDVQRINWMESQKYLRIGIGYNGHRFTSDVVVSDRERYQGRNIREAIDMAINAQRDGKETSE